MKQKRVSFYVPLELFNALKMYAVKNNMSMKMFMVELLIRELKSLGAIRVK